MFLTTGNIKTDKKDKIKFCRGSWLQYFETFYVLPNFPFNTSKKKHDY